MEVLKCVTLNHKIMNNPVKFTSFIAKSFLKQRAKNPLLLENQTQIIPLFTERFLIPETPKIIIQF